MLVISKSPQHIKISHRYRQEIFKKIQKAYRQFNNLETKALVVTFAETFERLLQMVYTQLYLLQN